MNYLERMVTVSSPNRKEIAEKILDIRKQTNKNHGEYSKLSLS